MLRTSSLNNLLAPGCRIFVAIAAATTVFASAAKADSFQDAFGELFARDQPLAHRTEGAPPVSADSFHRWNLVAIDATGLDHAPVAPGEIRIFGEQLGPARASR